MKTRKITALAAALILALSAASCGNSGDASAPYINQPAAAAQAADIEPAASKTSFEKSDSKVSDAFRKSAADFSAELLKKSALSDIKAGKNAFISPESVMMALGLAANGAGGDTLTQFLDMFGCKNMEEVNTALSALMSSAASNEQLGIANSIWVRDRDITLKQDYAEICKRRLDAESFLAPFSSETLAALNGWVNTKTKGMIPAIKDSFSEDEVAVLINCTTFEALWNDPYTNNPEDDKFTAASGDKQDCKMLYSTEHTYIGDDQASGFLKYYDGSHYAFAALLPNEGVSISDYADSLTGEKLLKLFGEPSYDYTVRASIPEFKFDWGKSIAEAVSEMGLDKAFMPSADFSNMAETSTGLLYIGDVIHKTHIELDRSGTKAAAATEIEMKCGAALIDEEKIKRVYLDRPFIFAIIDLETSLPVFMGAVNSIE